MSEKTAVKFTGDWIELQAKEDQVKSDLQVNRNKALIATTVTKKQGGASQG